MFYLSLGETKIKINFNSEGAKNVFESNGLEVYLFCLNFDELVASIWEHAKTLFGGLGVHGSIELFQPGVPDYMEEANVRFLQDYMNYTLVERPKLSQKLSTAVIDEDFI